MFYNTSHENEQPPQKQVTHMCGTRNPSPGLHLQRYPHNTPNQCKLPKTLDRKLNYNTFFLHFVRPLVSK